MLDFYVKTQPCEAVMSKILLFIPMYNCAPQIGRVAQQLSSEVFRLIDKVIFIDNRSTDNTLQAAQQAATKLPADKFLILKNHENYGLGGSHKVAFNYALDHGYSHVIVFHGDDQGLIADLLPHLHTGEHARHDCLLGARFMKGSKLQHYSLLRTVANYAFNVLFTLVVGRWIFDMGSGLNMYSRSCLENRRYLNYLDNLNFNHCMLLGSIDAGHKIKFVPISWREEDQISNAKLIHIGLLILKILAEYLVARRRLLDNDNSVRRNGIYSYDIIAGQE